MADVLRWITRLDAEQTIDELAGTLDASDAAGSDVARDVLLGLADRDAPYRSSVIATLETGLDAWLEPSVARATATAAASAPAGCSTGRTRCMSPRRRTTSSVCAGCSPR